MRLNTKIFPLFRSKLLAGGSAIAQSFTITDGLPMAGSVDGVGNLWVTVAAAAPGGLFGSLNVAPDNIDNVAPTALNTFLQTINRNTVFDGTNWDRLYSGSAANLAAFSGLGSALVHLPGDWAINHVPAAAAQATITRAAGAAGVRHVCTSISAHLGAVAVNGTQIINLRDGASGAGTILWSGRLGPLVVGTSDHIEISGLNIVGSAATAMTLEFAAAPAATNFETVSLTGHDAV
jgi:hypothetical protein